MDSTKTKTIETTKKYLTTATSIAASAMLARTLLNEFLPTDLRNSLSSHIQTLFTFISTNHTIIIQQNEGLNPNNLFDSARLYLRSKISPSTKRLRASKINENNKIIFTFDDGEEITDFFQGADCTWKLFCEEETQSNSRRGELCVDVRWFELNFNGKYKDMILSSYFPYIIERAEEIKAGDRRIRISMNRYTEWNCSVELNHPATFETLAMDYELKQRIMEDLDKFVKRKEYYKKTGKAWKRGYLLYGPPGTGKSSLIAAMANYLKFDINDLDLKEVSSNAELKSLLVGIPNRSILVIEDIDCSIDLLNRDEEENGGRKSKDDEVTLSGMLNCVDGLWSSSKEERIIVFTTNYKDRLDPALLRPGRMDMHVHMGYCGYEAFRVLALNYYGIEFHSLFEKIEGLLKEVEVTPAEISEELLRNDDVDVALGGVVELLKKKRGGSEEFKEKKEEKCVEEKEKQVGSEIGVRDCEVDEVLIGERDWSQDEC